MTSVHIIERYRRTREKLKLARMRGSEENEAERLEDELDALWSGMSESDHRTIRGIDGKDKRAA